MFYLLHQLLSPLPLQLLIVSLVATFQSSFPQHRASKVYRRHVLCAPATKKKKRKPIPMWGLCTQARTLPSPLLQNLPHRMRVNIDNILFSFHIPYYKQLKMCNCYFSKIRGTFVTKTITLNLLPKRIKQSDSFLDVLITKSSNNYHTSVFHKKTYTGLLTNFRSFSPLNYKIGLVRTLIDRTRSINNLLSGFKKDFYIETELFSSIFFRRNHYDLRRISTRQFL